MSAPRESSSHGAGGSPESLQIRPLGAEFDALRDELVENVRGGSFFHLAGWRSFLSELYGFVQHDLGAFEGDRLVGVLPLMECPSLLGRRRLISSPFGVYGGPAADDLEVRAALVRAACSLADRLGVGLLELRCDEPCGEPLASSDLYCTFRKQLPERAEEVLPRMPKKARAVARKARRDHGLVLVEGSWYLEDLARLFLENKHALGSPALPLVHFEELHRQLGRRVSVHVVQRERRPVAAVMSFAFTDRLVAYYGGSAQGADRSFGASNFMYMALQEWAVERGFRSFDFSRSRRDSGAHRFKEHQGFEAHPLDYRYHLVRDRKLPTFTPSNPRTQGLRSAWSRLPLWVARGLGGKLAARLP